MCAKYQSKFLESRIFSSCLSLVNVCSSNGLVKISANYSLVLIYAISISPCRRFDPGGSLDRRVNCRCVPQPRWVGARRNTKRGGNRGFVLSSAQGGCACSRGLQAFARERERERERACPSVRPPARPPPRTRALDLPFIDVRRGSRCTMGGVAIC
jgi:hypothetical protein